MLALAFEVGKALGKESEMDAYPYAPVSDGRHSEEKKESSKSEQAFWCACCD
jgi:hypothetical protein